MGQVTLAVLCLIAGAAAGYAIAHFKTGESVRAEFEPKLADSERRATESGALVAAAREDAKKAETEISGLRSTLDIEKTGRTKAEEALSNERQRLVEERQLLANAEMQLRDAFNALAADALNKNNEAFLNLANQKLDTVRTEAASELEMRKKAVEVLVQPISRTLENLDAQIREIEKARSGAYSLITNQVESLIATQAQLATQTTNLVGALKSPTVRGNWGEMQLRRVVELAGMVDYCDFQVQVSVEDENERRFRPDLVVKLPGGTQVVVDAKATGKAYMEALEAGDEASRKACLQKHAKEVSDRIRDLSSKRYWEQFATAPDFVVMFLPGETFFAAALEQDPSLIEQGVVQNVVVASPTTLIALLRAIAYGWRQEKIAESAKEISQLGSDLYERLRVMGDHFESVGANLNSAVKAFNAAVNSMESRVFPAARKFTSLGATTKKEIPELAPVEEEAHGLHARDWSRGLSIAASSEEPVHAKADAPGQED